MATPNYDINYDDKRFSAVESDKAAAMNGVDATYNNMINSSDKFYQDQMNAADDYAKQQSEIQQQQTDFAIQQIEQNKEQANKDYIKEQSGSYADWQKQSNQYGANAEKMAASGLANSGYSESSMVSMYNTYQNRVATAREVYNRAILDYDNQITEARLQNSSVLAEIAYNALQKRLELATEGFQYKNQLIIDKANKKLEVDNTYYNRYQDVLKQINTENAIAEEVRQYNEKMAEEKRQYNETQKENKRQFDESQKEKKRQFDESQKFEKEKFNWQKSQATTSGGSSNKSPSGNEQKKKDDNVIKKDDDVIKKGDNVTVDTPNMKSVLDLGLGPISATQLAKLVAQGAVTVTKKNGQLYYKKAEGFKGAYLPISNKLK